MTRASTPDWAAFVVDVLALPGGPTRSSALAQVCLAADPTMAESGGPGRPPGRPPVSEVRTAAAALAGSVAAPTDRTQRSQRIVALVFRTWQPQIRLDSAVANADIDHRADECAEAVALAREERDPLLLAWSLGHLSRALRQAHRWSESLAAATEAASLTEGPADPTPGPWAAAPDAVAESPMVVRAVLACRAFKDMGMVAASLGDIELWRDAIDRMTPLAESLVPVRPSLLAEALSHRGGLARHIGDRDGFRAVEARLRSWAEQSGLNRAHRAWLAQAAYNAAHLHDHSRAYELLRARLVVSLQGVGLEGEPTPASVGALVPELRRRGLRSRRIAVGNSAYDCAVQLWKTRSQLSVERWELASAWLDVAESAYSGDGRNGLAAVRFTRARLLACHPTAGDPLRAADLALAAGATGVRAGLMVNAAVAAAEWCAPGDTRVFDRLTELSERATPRHRGVLNYALACWHRRVAEDADTAEGTARAYADAESAALASCADLEFDGVVVDMEKAARSWWTAALACGLSGRTEPDEVPATTLRRLLAAVRCVAELFIGVSDLAERAALGQQFGGLFREAADLAVRLGDAAAMDRIMEAVRRDRVGALISDLARSPAVTDAVRRAAESVIAANAARPALPETEIPPASESRVLSRTADAIAETRRRSVSQADRILGVLSALADGRGLPDIDARSVLELCPQHDVSAVLQLLASEVSALGGGTSPRVLYRRLTWRDGDGIVHEHTDAVPLPFSPARMTPDQPGYWLVLARLTRILLPEPLLGLTAGSAPVRLMIVPTGLFDIAFDVLPLDGSRQLVDAAVVSVHASLTTMTHLLRRAVVPAVQPSIAVYDLDRLTHTEPEFRSLESYLPPLFEVTSRAVLVSTLGSGETTGYRMLALAVHGTDDVTDGWGQSKILPDGTELTAAEAMALSFPQLCVLASCHSSVRLRGGVELAGFPLALFARGATTVVGSLHEIDDESTSQVMQRFWKHMGDGTDPVRALRDAKLGWLAEKPDRRLTPRLWGGLVALGGAHF
ncbi:CHAT domain-containing protein [Micromonospora sp. NPDC049060]|uniref:CHAT domain-containing protein n=1 Tax=Micromonospora sp. NPDC049060 TaxID=3154828 RepID=UPI0033C87E9D